MGDGSLQSTENLIELWRFSQIPIGAFSRPLPPILPVSAPEPRLLAPYLLPDSLMCLFFCSQNILTGQKTDTAPSDGFE